MPGFADNFRRMCQAAGIPIAEAVRRVGAKPADAEGWLAAGALPELHVLARLADAMGCRVDDLLIGADEDFDHPQRRHAALIAARMARLRVLLTQARVARCRGELAVRHEPQLDEAALLATVEGCRAWVMSEAHDVEAAAAIEAELDGHLDRVGSVLAGTQRPAAPVPAQMAPPRTNGTSPGAALSGARARATVVVRAEPVSERAGATVAALPAAAPRARGHRSRLWSQEHEDQQHECVMVTRSSEVDVELLVDDRVIQTRTCRTLDEALQQSSEWKRTYLVPAILALPELPR